MTGRAEGNRVVVLRPELDKDDAGAVDGDEQGGWSARFGWWVLAVGLAASWPGRRGRRWTTAWRCPASSS